MKRIVKFTLVALVAALSVLACKKNTVPEKTQDTTQDDKKQNEEVVEEIKLAVDGKFTEWSEIAAIKADEDVPGILVMKTQMNDSKLYFYIEVDAAMLDVDDAEYANYLTICFDCGGDGAEKITYWGGDAGAAYDFNVSIWLMQKGKANMACWWDGGTVTGKGKLADGIYRAEFSFPRTDKNLLKSKEIYFGAYLTNQTVVKEEGEEQWLDGETIGICPAKGEDMAKVK